MCLLLYLGQTRLIFFPSPTLKATPADVNLEYEDVWLSVNQEKIHGWWVKGKTKQAVLYLHGNGSNLGDCVNRIARLHKLGLAVLIIDYRGYGYSSKTFPNEKRVYEDGEAGWQYLTQKQQIKPHQIILYGHSLGGAIAIELATRHPTVGGVIVESTFTSIKDMLKYQLPLPILPVKLLLREKFDSLAKVKQLKTPILIIHGTSDRTVPFTMSQQLYAATSAPKKLLLIPNANHQNASSVNETLYLQTIEQFLKL